MRVRSPIALLLTAICAVALISVPVNASSQNDGESRVTSGFPFCAWWVETSTQNSNVAFPDTSAAYWTTPFPLNPSSTVEVQGTFTDGRYYSIQVYDGQGQPASQVYTTSSGNVGPPQVANYLTDFNIVPQPGSINPFSTGVFPSSTNDYVVNISADQGNAQNWIPMPAATQGSPSGAIGMLMLRAYLPANPPLAGQAPLTDIDVTSAPPFSLLREDLPVVTVIDASGQRTTFATCPQSEASQLMKTTEAGVSLAAAIKGDVTLAGNEPCPEVISADPGTPCVPRLEFFKTTSGQTPFPNGDSAYVTAKYVLPPGQALVVQAILPTTPWDVGDGSDVMAWPATSTGQNPAWNLRYFSMCNYVHRAPFPVVSVSTRMGQLWGCANDVQIREAIGSSSSIVGVVTRVAERPQSIRGQGVGGKDYVWLPASRKSADAEMLISIRNMLAAPSFAQSATKIPIALDPSAALKTMRAYYPTASTCDVEILERFGVLRCTAVHRAIERCSGINGLNQTPTGVLQRDGSIRADLRGNAPAVRAAVQNCIDELLTSRGTVTQRNGKSVRHVSGCLVKVDSDCRGLDLRRANFQDANLTRVTMSHAHLGKANLSGAKLTEMHAPRAVFTGSDLSDAKANGAELSQSLISSTNASGADLSGGTLVGAVIRSSDLSGADLSRADLTNSTLSNVDLTDARTSGVVVTGAIAQSITTPGGARCSGLLADCLGR